MSMNTAGRVLNRVAQRASAAMWRRKGTTAMVASVALLLGGYGAYRTDALPLVGTVPAVGVEVAGARAAGSDCAAIAMRFIAERGEGGAPAMYRCLTPEMTGGLAEAEWIAQVSAMPAPAGNAQAQRVGEYAADGGEKIVFYALDTAEEDVGYILYLDPNGKVRRIE